jgi:hypothetical protein
MHILFVAPHFPSYQRHFVRAMHSVGAKVTGIGEASLAHLDSELKSWMVGYEQVPSVCDEQAMLDAVRRVQRRSYVDRLETTIEAHILPTAAVREATGIPGLSVKAAVLCRDKPQMKEHLRAHGIPCAASDGIDVGRRSDRLRAPARLPDHHQAAGRRRRLGHQAVVTTTDSWPRRSKEPGSTADSRWPSRSSSRATRASTTPCR